MPRSARRMPSNSLRCSVAAAVEWLEGRVLLSTYTVTNLNDAGPGSLGDAIDQTNAHEGADGITFAPGLGGTITGGAPTITDDLTITGPGPSLLTVNGGFSLDAFAGPAPNSAALNISGLTINGELSGNNSSTTITASDCALTGVENYGQTVLRGCTISGGGIVARGGFDISDSTISNCSINTADIFGDTTAIFVPVGGNGGGSLTNCTITDNPGDGVFVEDSFVTLTRCTVSDNHGVGVFNDGSTVQLIDSSVSGSGSSGLAGGEADFFVSGSTIANNKGGGITGGGEGLTLLNSTVANNIGGGIAGMAQMIVTNSTIVGNSGATPAGIAVSGTTHMNNSIIAGNRNANGDASDLGAPGGFPVTGSNNLVGTGGSGGLVNGQNGNLVGVAEPKLAPLGDYGGPTQTMPPLTGSPAIDAGNNALAVNNEGKPLISDQRGDYRIVNGTVDIGATEFDSTPVIPDGTVTNLNDSGPGSLRDAIEEANIHPGQDTIRFAPGLSGTITLTSGELTITDSLSIVGPGAGVLAVGGNHAGGVFEIDPLGANIGRAAVNISGITVAAGQVGVSGDSWTDLILTDCVLTGNSISDGVVVSSEGTASITNCTISGNAQEIAVISGPLSMSGCTVSGNGGGISASQAEISNTVVSNNGQAGISINSGSVTNCTVTGNEGEGIQFIATAPVTITNCTIAGNRGSGISFLRGERATIAGCTLSGNAGDGGILADGPTLVVNCTIADNTGSGISSNSTLRVVNSTISGNVAGQGAEIWLSDTPGCGPTSASIDNTIVAANHGTKGGASDLSVSPDAQAPGTFSGSNNLIGTGGSGGLVNGQNGNLVGVGDPMLAPLGDYGGPTQTMPPLDGSPAIDAGDNALAVDENGKPLLSDQRGDYRIVSGKVDIGAVEFNSSPIISGDANGDGKVDFADLLLVAQNYRKSAGATWANGDFNSDGSVAFDDLLLLAQHYGQRHERALRIP